MGSLEEKFIGVCDEYFSSHQGYERRGEQGRFSFAMVVWLGVQSRIKGHSLRASLSALVDRAKSGTGVDFLISRSNSKLRSLSISGNTGGISRARDRFSLQSVRELFTRRPRGYFLVHLCNQRNAKSMSLMVRL